MYLMPMGIVGGVYILARRLHRAGRSAMGTAPAAVPQSQPARAAEAGKGH
jgi:hypothetical protein